MRTTSKYTEHKNITKTELLIGLSTTVFFLHLLWEYAQCSSLFIHLKVTPTFLSMICATLGDVAIFWFSYSAVGYFSNSVFWPWTSRSLVNWALLVGTSALAAEVVEYFAVRQELWSYTSINPTVAGISIAPIIQMATLNPLSIILIKKLLVLKELTIKTNGGTYDN
jgi:hypothetical protein